MEWLFLLAATVSLRTRRGGVLFRAAPIPLAVILLYTEVYRAMKTKYPIGILGATGMVGQRFIQLLENHPWFEVAWLAASDRSSGKNYGEAAKWRLDTPLPERMARMTVSPAEPEGAPKIIFAALDAAIAREMEPSLPPRAARWCRIRAPTAWRPMCRW